MQHAPSFQVFEATDEALKEEDAAKERLCSELNMLVQQSAHAQLEKLEQVHLLSPHSHLACCHEARGRVAPTRLQTHVPGGIPPMRGTVQVHVISRAAESLLVCYS